MALIMLRRMDLPHRQHLLLLAVGIGSGKLKRLPPPTPISCLEHAATPSYLAVRSAHRRAATKNFA